MTAEIVRVNIEIRDRYHHGKRAREITEATITLRTTDRDTADDLIATNRLDQAHYISPLRGDDAELPWYVHSPEWWTEGERAELTMLLGRVQARVLEQAHATRLEKGRSQ